MIEISVNSRKNSDFNHCERRKLYTHIGIELADEAGEVVMLEIGRKKETGELRGVPDDEAIVGGAP